MTQRNLRFYIQAGCGVFVLSEILLFSIIVFLGHVQRNPTWDHARRIEGTIHAIEPASMQFRGYGMKHSIILNVVQFEYIVDEDVFRVSQSVTTPFFVGQRVDIIYLPETPWIAEIAIPDYSPLLPISLIGCIAIPVVSLIIGILVRRTRASEKPKRKPHQEGIYDQTTL